MILLTGATGFLGSQLAYELAVQDKRFRAVKRPGSSIPDKLKPFAQQIEWIDGNVLDLASLEKAMKNVKQVYHCAAMVSFNPLLKKHMFRVNIEGTANVVNTALASGVEKLVHVSSIAALGRGKPGELITEEMAWNYSTPGSAYAVSKFESEREVRRAMEEGLSAVIVNPSVIIGPGNWKSDSSALFSKVYSGNYFYPAGTMGFVDVRDVSRAMIRLMENQVEGDNFIITAENISFRDLLSAAARELGCKPPKWKINPGLLHISAKLAGIYAFLFRQPVQLSRSTARALSEQFRYSNEKIKKITGMNFIPVEEAIRETSRVFLKENLS